jgi:hypothetical protein
LTTNNIEKYLTELMYQHDCVVIPGLGGLVANYTPATRQNEGGLITPPAKSFMLNRFLTHNDGLLAHKISESEGLSYQESVDLIEEYVQTINTALFVKGSFSWDSIGVLHQDEQKSLRFEIKKQNYQLSSFGLPMVKLRMLPKLEVAETPIKQLVPEHIESQLPKEIIEEKVIGISSPYKETRIRSGANWWVAAALIPLAFYSAWIPMKTDMLKGNGNFQYADLNPFSYEKATYDYLPSSFQFTSVDRFEMISFDVIDQYVEQKQAANRGITHINESTYVASNEEAVVKTAVINLEQASYFVIGGCFSEKENAETFVSQLQEQGFDAMLVDKNKGLHRVAFGGYASRKAAKKALHKITASGEHSAWVLKKS